MTDHELAYLNGMLNEFKEKVIAEFRDNRDDHKAIQSKIDSITKDIAKSNMETAKAISGLKSKSGTWGMIGGAMPILVAMLVYLANKMFFGGN